MVIHVHDCTGAGTFHREWTERHYVLVRAVPSCQEKDFTCYEATNSMNVASDWLEPGIGGMNCYIKADAASWMELRPDALNTDWIASAVVGGASDEDLARLYEFCAALVATVMGAE